MCQFLEEINLGQHVAAFSGEEISGEMLLEAEDEMLQELGVNSPIERLKIRVCVWGGEREEEKKGGCGRTERGKTGGGTQKVPYFLFIPGVVPAETARWCGAVSPTDSAELPGAEQAEQVFGHFSGIRHGW